MLSPWLWGWFRARSKKIPKQEISNISKMFSFCQIRLESGPMIYNFQIIY